MKYWRTCCIGHWGISDEEMDFKRTVDVVRSIQSVPVLLRTVICGRSDLPEAVHTRFAGCVCMTLTAWISEEYEL